MWLQPYFPPLRMSRGQADWFMHGARPARRTVRRTCAAPGSRQPFWLRRHASGHKLPRTLVYSRRASRGLSCTIGSHRLTAWRGPECRHPGRQRGSGNRPVVSSCSCGSESSLFVEVAPTCKRFTSASEALQTRGEDKGCIHSAVLLPSCSAYYGSRGRRW